MTAEEKYAKGARGEEIMKRRFEDDGFTVKSPAVHSLVDFLVGNDSGSFFAEIKVRSTPLNYAYRFECYTFPKTQIDAYADYACTNIEQRAVYLYILNPVSKKIFKAEINQLLEPFFYEDKQFPFLMPSDDNGGQSYAFFVEQFEQLEDLSEEEAAYINGEIENDTASNAPKINSSQVDLNQCIVNLHGEGERWWRIAKALHAKDWIVENWSEAHMFKSYFDQIENTLRTEEFGAFWETARLAKEYLAAYELYCKERNK